MASEAKASAIQPRFRTWPISATKVIESQLQEMGLKIPAERIDGTSTTTTSSGDSSCPPPLSDALVSVGQAGRGGTGSFVSEDGLIITNWHVAYDAVRQASLLSSEGKDYVKDGFVSRSREEELHGPNYECWITKKCVDVSDQVLAAINKSEEGDSASSDDPLVRANRIRNIMQEIAQKEQKATTSSQSSNNDDDGTKYRCDVQEMLPNKSYVLFTYERLRDVRIVYVPPKSLGNFGGDTDNFEWPRHTADFTLLRAYTGPKGEAAEYSPNNIPYKSHVRIKVQKDGAKENDMVFLLGFPGRTMRYAPTSRLLYADEIAVPNMVKDFTRKLQLIDQFEKDSPEAALKLGSSKKGLANELKRSKGKLIMMRKLDLIPERQQEEDFLCQKVPEAKAVLDRLSEIYGEFRKTETTSTALEACRGIYRGSALMAAGHSLHEYLVIEKSKPDTDREASYRQRNLPFLFKRTCKRLDDIHAPHEVALIKDAIATLNCDNSELKVLHNEITKMMDEKDLEGIVESSKLRDPNLMSTLDTVVASTSDEKDNEAMKTIATLLEDPFIKCASVLWDTYKENHDTSKALLSERDVLFAKLLDWQAHVSPDENIWPDCNGSLRISAGHVEGYQAADAVTHHPSTTLAGLFDKATEAKLSMDDDGGEFTCPQRLHDLLSSSDKEGGEIGNVPVCLLYSTDTVGGNSGSPVMNCNGEFCGINFDRQRQGLMNEYKWSKDYSRSIAVDVRYILWLIGEYDAAGHLVDEMLS